MGKPTSSFYCRWQITKVYPLQALLGLFGEWLLWLTKIVGLIIIVRVFITFALFVVIFRGCLSRRHGDGFRGPLVDTVWVAWARRNRLFKVYWWFLLLYLLACSMACRLLRSLWPLNLSLLCSSQSSRSNYTIDIQWDASQLVMVLDNETILSAKKW